MIKFIRQMIFIGISLALFSSCSSGQQIGAGSYWDKNPDGTIQTNDASRLQGETPFTIIFPRYIPGELKGFLPTLIKLNGIYSENDVEIRIFYRTTASPNYVHIIEVNSPIKWVPNGDLEYTYLDFAGVKVLEERSTKYVQWAGQQVPQPVLNYMWNQGNVSLNTAIVGYAQIESRRIIESMIES